MNGRRLIVALAAVSALAFVGAGCSGDDDGDGGGDAPADVTVTAEDFRFDPATIAVPSGETTIEIANTGEVEHNITLDDDSASQDVEPGESATITVNVTETIGFHCEYHPTQMTGTLEVS